jgi:hypothetical protein
MAMGAAGAVDPHTESIEGASYASLFDPAATPDPSKVTWTNKHNASFSQYPRCCGQCPAEPHKCAVDFSDNKRCAGTYMLQLFQTESRLSVKCLTRSDLLLSLSPLGSPTPGVPKYNFSYMGYSIRTTEWRYTEYAQWDGPNLKPIWMADPTAPNALVELYDHRADSGSGANMWNDFENENLASSMADVVRALSARVRGFFPSSKKQLLLLPEVET